MPMRVLRILFTGFFTIIVLAVGAFFGAREVLLWWASNSITASIEELGRSEIKGAFAQQCQRLVGSDVFTSITAEYQLRFLTDREYTLEVVCDESAKNPILISRKKLPLLVSKVPGSSGILPDAPLSGIRLTVFAEQLGFVRELVGHIPDFLVRERAVVLSQGAVLADKDPEELGVGPVTSCEGYGFMCCDAQTQMGAGESLAGAQDCPSSCFSSCITRPVLLSFTTDPFINPQTRSLTVAPGGTVSFHYVADAGKSDELNAILRFGDGEQVQLQGTTGSTEHKYTCPRQSCTYTAQIELSDTWGVRSLPGKLYTVAVTVSGGV